LDRKDAIDDAAQASVGKTGQEVVAERLDGDRLLLERARAQHRPDDAPTPARKGPQREFRLFATAATDDEETPLRREYVDVESEVRPADELEDHVCSAGRPNPLRPVA